MPAFKPRLIWISLLALLCAVTTLWAAPVRSDGVWYLEDTPHLLIIGSRPPQLDNGLVAYHVARADASGGELDVTVDGRVNDRCPGGSLKLLFTWSLSAGATAI